MNLQPFTIEAYERGEEVVYRDGTKPDEIFISKFIKDYPILTIKGGILHTQNKNGIFSSQLSNSQFDLLIKPKTITKYRNEYESGIVGAWKDSIEQTERVAHRNATGGYDKSIAISKGEFVKDMSRFMRLKLISIEIIKP